MNNISTNYIARSASFEASGLEVPQCYCRLDAVWRKVSKEGANHGRHFWGCPRFGQADGEQKCRFFQWADEELVNLDQGGLGKTTPNSVDRHILSSISLSPQNGNASSGSQRRVRFVQLQSEESLPTVVGDDDDDDLHVITGRSSNSFENSNTLVSFPRSNLSNHVTKIKNYKYYQPASTENQIPSPRVIADPKKRHHILAKSDDGIPRFTTPELLEVIENHMNQQDRFGARQELSKELVREEIRQLHMQTDQIIKEMEFTKRENQLLKGEKRVLERDLETAREELKEFKRRKGDQ